MCGILQGYPTNADTSPFGQMSIAEMRLFVGEDLASYAFHRASGRPVATGHDDVHAAAWSRSDGCLVYLANYAEVRRSGALRFPGAARIVDGRLSCRLRQPGAQEALVGPVDREAIARGAGLPFVLEPWSSALFLVGPARQ